MRALVAIRPSYFTPMYEISLAVGIFKDNPVRGEIIKRGEGKELHDLYYRSVGQLFESFIVMFESLITIKIIYNYGIPKDDD